jgi:hypothetical protein
MIDRKLIVTFLLATGLVLLWGRWRPPEAWALSGLDPDLFWRAKVEMAPAYDLILAGDSRTYMNLDPETMASVLRGYRIFNFGFPQVGYSAKYLNRVEAGLDPASQKKSVVLGITPLSLTRWAVAVNGFKARTKHQDGAVARWARPVLDRFMPVWYFFRPIELKDLIYALIGKPQPCLNLQRYYANGWAACNGVPPNEASGLQTYQPLFDGNTVSPQVIAVVLDTTRRWSDAGIQVFGYRPPTTEAMTALEQEKSRFDEADFAARFQAAGGHWLPVTPFGRYSSFDGSHLADTSARALSTDLATAIRDTLQAPSPGPP